MNDINRLISQQCPSAVSFGSVLRPCPSAVSFGSVLRQCPSAVSFGSVLRQCPLAVSIGSVLRQCPSAVSFGSVLRQCPSAVSFGSVAKVPCRMYQLIINEHKIFDDSCRFYNIYQYAIKVTLFILKMYYNYLYIMY